MKIQSIIRNCIFLITTPRATAEEARLYLAENHLPITKGSAFVSLLSALDIFINQ